VPQSSEEAGRGLLKEELERDVTKAGLAKENTYAETIMGAVKVEM